jgi:hypothetical protein
MATGESNFEYLEPVLCDLVGAFTGDRDEDKNYNGKGEMKMRNGSLYVGDIKAGLFHGTGKFTWPDNVIYEGTFVYGTIDGKGKYSWPDGSKYTGDVKAGKRSGNGIFQCSASQNYDGEWLDGLRHGKGTATYAEGKNAAIYTGDWVNGLRQGYGIMNYSTGNTYEGHWFNDQKNGMGLMVWKDKDQVYAGEWKDDKPHGQGENLWSNLSLSKLMTKQMSSIYRGQWNNGVKHGDGAFFYSDGSTYFGKWDNDGKIGHGVMQYGDGVIKPAKFQNGQNILQLPPEPPKQTNHKKGGGNGAHSNGSNINGSVAGSPSTRQGQSQGQDDNESSVKLHIRDLLLSLPKSDGKKDPCKEHVTTSRIYMDEKFASNNDTEARELERLLLRFNISLKQIHQRLVDSGHKDRRKSNIIDTLEKADFTRMHNAIATAINNHQKFLCMSLKEFKGYCRELGLIGTHFTYQQVSDALYRAVEEQKLIANNTYVTQQIALSRPSTPAPATVPVSVPKTNTSRNSSDLLNEIEIKSPDLPDVWGTSIGPTSVKRTAFDDDQPICEQNFYNVLVRCAISSDIAQSGSNPVHLPSKPLPEEIGDYRLPLELFKGLLNVLSGIHSRHEHKPALAPLVAAISSDEVQNILYTNKSKFNTIWEQIVHDANIDGVYESVNNVAQLRHIVRAFLKLRGKCMRESVKAVDIIRILQKSVKDIPAIIAPMCPQTAAPEPTPEVEAEVPVIEEAAPATAGEVEPATEDGNTEEVPPGTAPGTRPTTAAVPDVPKPIDYSTLINLVDYEDFCDMLCKLMMSDLWIFNGPAPKASVVETLAAVEGEGGEASNTSEESASETKTVEPAVEAAPTAEEIVVEETELPLQEALLKRIETLCTHWETVIAV